MNMRKSDQKHLLPMPLGNTHESQGPSCRSSYWSNEQQPHDDQLLAADIEEPMEQIIEFAEDSQDQGCLRYTPIIRKPFSSNNVV